MYEFGQVLRAEEGTPGMLAEGVGERHGFKVLCTPVSQKN